MYNLAVALIAKGISLVTIQGPEEAEHANKTHDTKPLLPEGVLVLKTNVNEPSFLPVLLRQCAFVLDVGDSLGFPRSTEALALGAAVITDKTFKITELCGSGFPLTYVVDANNVSGVVDAAASSLKNRFSSYLAPEYRACKCSDPVLVTIGPSSSLAKCRLMSSPLLCETHASATFRVTVNNNTEVCAQRLDDSPRRGWRQNLQVWCEQMCWNERNTYYDEYDVSVASFKAPTACACRDDCSLRNGSVAFSWFDPSSYTGDLAHYFDCHCKGVVRSKAISVGVFSGRLV